MVANIQSGWSARPVPKDLVFLKASWPEPDGYFCPPDSSSIYICHELIKLEAI